MALIDIKQLRGASQGSVLFLGTNSIVSENYNNLRWDQTTNTLIVDGGFQYIDGNQQSGYILVSDSSGNATWTSSVAVGATNGLSEISTGVIGLGGTLSQNTTINSEGLDFTIQNFDTLTFTGSVVDVQLDNGLFLVDSGDTGSVDIYSGDTTIFASYSIDVVTNGVFNLVSNTSSITSNNLEGLVYTSDYTGTFVTNSLVTKGYVDSVASSIGADNGLSEITPGTVSLGGTLSQNTIINSESYDFTIQNFDTLTFTGSVVDVQLDNGLFLVDVDNGSVDLYGGDSTIVFDTIDISATNELVLTAGTATITTTNLEGLVYTTDYTGTFVTNSLITKGYVDSLVSAVGATNGLTEYLPGIVGLGGTLSQNTTINGDLFDLTIENLNTLTVTASLIDFQLDNGSVFIDSGDNGTVDIYAGGVLIYATSSIDIATNGEFTITTSTGSVTTTNLEGLVYTSDYTGTFVTNSLITKQYVDNALSSFSGGMTPSNGLSEISTGVIGLGGTLSQNTTISGNLFDLTIGNIDIIHMTSSVFDVEAEFVSIDAGTGSMQLIADYDIDIVSTTGQINITGDSGNVTIDNLEGLVYTQDYTSTFVTYSLITKGYVDAGTASLWNAINSIGGGGGMTPSNGLSEISTGVIGLGGTLSQNTYINGDGYSLTVGNVDIIHMTSSIFDVEAEFVSIDAGTGSMQLIADDDIDILSNGNQISIGGQSGRVTTGNLEGLVYTSDYTGTFITQSLITKGYVDAGTSSIWNYITTMGANTSGTSGTSGYDGTSGTSGSSGTGFNTISNPGNNRLLTSDGTTNAADAESNLTFDGTNLSVNGNVFISGSISVAGSASIVNTTNLTVFDPIIALGVSQSGSPVLDEGLMFVRGTGATQAFIWDESEDRFALVQTNDNYDVVGNVNIDSYSNLRVGDLFIGETQTPSLYTTKKVTLSSGTNSIYNFATSSYSGAFVDYTIESGSNARSGNLMSIWNGNSIQYVENSTIDIGNTTGVTFSFVISGSNAVLQAISDTSGWMVKTILRSI